MLDRTACGTQRGQHWRGVGITGCVLKHLYVALSVGTAGTVLAPVPSLLKPHYLALEETLTTLGFCMGYYSAGVYYFLGSKISLPSPLRCQVVLLLAKKVSMLL